MPPLWDNLVVMLGKTALNQAVVLNPWMWTFQAAGDDEWLEGLRFPVREV
jgi:hypothetical protein